MKRALSILFGLALAILVSWGSIAIAENGPATSDNGVGWSSPVEPALSFVDTQRQAPAPMTERPIILPDGTVMAQSCCKHCTSGKPCGDSCIARNKTCHSGRGCACATVDIY